MIKQLMMIGAFLSIILFSGTVYSQQYIPERDVPLMVRNDFYDNYDLSASVNWTNGDDDTYTAEYIDGTFDNRITFDAVGIEIRTETEMNAHTLPDPVMNSFIGTYPDGYIDYSTRIEDDNGVHYRLGYTDGYGGSERSYIYYKEDGTIFDMNGLD